MKSNEPASQTPNTPLTIKVVDARGRQCVYFASEVRSPTKAMGRAAGRIDEGYVPPPPEEEEEEEEEEPIA